jgi:hypothetical protein
MTELKAKYAKSVFHFDVQGSVAKSTHTGIGWLSALRKTAGAGAHFWPFDGWRPRKNRHVITEVYPRLYNGCSEVPSNLTPDQTDAFLIAAWLQKCDQDHTLAEYFEFEIPKDVKQIARYEGWILGVR